MEVDILYGRNGLTVNLPDDIKVTVVRKYPMTPLSKPFRAVKKALQEPVGCSPLGEIARGKKRLHSDLYLWGQVCL